jgi:hypothetical protein
MNYRLEYFKVWFSDVAESIRLTTVYVDKASGVWNFEHVIIFIFWKDKDDR